MNDQSETTSDSVLPGDLPKVEPPSASFIVQLFLIPGLIVIAIVSVWLLFGAIASGSQDPSQILADLRSPNRERSWHAARQLAGRLPEDESLRANSSFCSGLIGLFHDHMSDITGELPEEEILRLQYLAIALGEIQEGDQALVDAVASNIPPRLRHVAMVGLGRVAYRHGGFSDESILPKVVASVEDTEPEIRKVTARTLAMIDSPMSVKALESMLYDSDREVRYNAAASLAKLGQSSSLKIIVEMLNVDQIPAEPAHLRLMVPLSALESLKFYRERVTEPLPADVMARIEHLAKTAQGRVGLRALELSHSSGQGSEK